METDLGELITLIRELIDALAANGPQPPAPVIIKESEQWGPVIAGMAATAVLVLIATYVVQNRVGKSLIDHSDLAERKRHVEAEEVSLAIRARTTVLQPLRTAMRHDGHGLGFPWDFDSFGVAEFLDHPDHAYVDSRTRQAVRAWLDSESAAASRWRSVDVGIDQVTPRITRDGYGAEEISDLWSTIWYLLLGEAVGAQLRVDAPLGGSDPMSVAVRGAEDFMIAGGLYPSRRPPVSKRLETALAAGPSMLTDRKLTTLRSDVRQLLVSIQAAKDLHNAALAEIDSVLAQPEERYAQLLTP